MLVALLGVSTLLLLWVPWAFAWNGRPVTDVTKQRCGPSCVIESMQFDTKEDAEYWVKENTQYKRTAPYQLKGSEGWFVDYQVSESEANLI